MSTEDPHPEGSGFDEALESLLSETDPLRAEEAPSDDSSPNQDDAPADEVPESNELGDAALDAIDSVEQNAQSLIEDAIDTLLDPQDEAEPVEEGVEEVEAEAEDVVEAEAADTEIPTDDIPSTDDLQAQLDALETSAQDEPGLDDDLEALTRSMDELEIRDEVTETEDEPAAEVADEVETQEDPSNEPGEVEDTAISDDAEDSEMTEDPVSEIEDVQVDVHDEEPIDADETVSNDATDFESDDDLLSSVAADLMELDESVSPEPEPEIESDTEPEPESDIEPEPEPESVSDIESELDALADETEDISSAAIEDTLAESEPETQPETEPESIAEEETPDAVLDDDPFADAIDQLVESSAEIDQALTDPVDDAVEPDPVDQTDGDSIEESLNDTIETDAGSEEFLEDASTLADLDATLAGIGDDLLTGDFETPEGELIGSDDLGISDASPLLDMLDMGDLDFNSESIAKATSESESESSAPEPAPAASAADEQDSTEPGASESAPAPAPVAPPKPKPIASTPLASMSEGIDDSPIPEVESIWQTARRIGIQIGTRALSETRTHAIPLGAKALVLVNKPVRERPAIVRDSIGYLAMWTGLLATILWIYLAFVRVTPTPTPTQAPSRMLEPGEVIDPLRNASADP